MIAIIGIILATGILLIWDNIIPTIRADAASQLVVSQLQQARQAALDQRRPFILSFQGTNEILMQRVEFDPSSGLATGVVTTMGRYFLPHGMTYMVFPSLGSTPDGFSPNPSHLVNFGGYTRLNFQSDGTVLLYPSSTSVLANGAVFMGIEGKATTARVVSVWGATGTIRSYRSDGVRFH